jgi:hypothetical protein
MVSQKYTSWSDCTDFQAGLDLFWRQRLVTFDSMTENTYYYSVKKYIKKRVRK